MLADLTGFLVLSFLVAVVYSGLHRDRVPDILRLGLKRFVSFSLLTIGFAVVLYVLTEVI